MSWYYADWTWIHRFIVTATTVMAGVVIVCAIVTLVRSHLAARHAEVIVTNGFVQPSKAELQREVRRASHHRNGTRAA